MKLTGRFASSGLAGLLLASALTVSMVAGLAPVRNQVGLVNVGFIFLLLTLFIASTYGRELGFYTAVVTNLAFNYFFLEPLHRFAVNEPRNVFALVLFLLVSVMGGTLLSAAREAAEQARRRQAETEVALTLSRAMSRQTEPDQALEALCREVTRAFMAPGAAVLTRSGDGWLVLAHDGSEAAGRAPDHEEQTTAERASLTTQILGLGMTGLDTTRRRRIVFPGGRAAPFSRERAVLFVPLVLAEHALGVLRLDGPIGDSPFQSQPERLLNAVASEAALAVQRIELAKEAAHAEALREADKLKTALMASISHDLKTPLAAIKASVSSILDKQVHWSEQDIDAFLQTIDSQADRLNRVISDILDLNRIESGSLMPEQAPLRAVELLNRAREITAWETRGREVSVDAPGGLRLIGDESLLIQALVNLIENANKYSTPGRAIHLHACEATEGVALSVEDEGPGIPAEDLPSIFERFYRGEEHARRIKGTGLGLTIVKGFVEMCGGSVSVDSSPAGTRFTVLLPAASALVKVGTA